MDCANLELFVTSASAVIGTLGATVVFLFRLYTQSQKGQMEMAERITTMLREQVDELKASKVRR